MRVSWLPLLALTASAPAASALEVVHQPASCSTPDAYLRIAARGGPAEGVASGEVRFRVDARDPWYVVRMTAQDGDWAAALPRPQALLKRFQYQVVLTGPDAQSAATEPITVDVRADCPAAGTAVADTIVVQVPPGAPVVPPVPAGFSPVGVTGPAVAKKSHKGLKILGGVAVAGAGAGVAAAVGSTTHAAPEEPQALTFAFDGVTPQPGTTLTPGSTLTVFLRVSPQPRRSMSLQWTMQLLSPSGVVCSSLFGRTQGVQGETLIPLSTPVFANPVTCGSSFDVASLRLNLAFAQAGIESTELQLPLAYRYQNNH
jgi:hypothetical protein